MTRMHEAVERDLAATPLPPPVEYIQTRARRRRRRRVAAIVAVATVVSIASVGIAASLGRERNGPQVSVSPTMPPRAANTEWCVAFSRAQAVRGGIAYGYLDFKNPIVHAKLVSLAELLDAKNNPPFATNDPLVHLREHSKFWVVELRATETSSQYTWTLVAFDANTGNLVTASGGPSIGPGGIEGPATEPPYWDALPDHADECPKGSAVSTTTTTTIDAATDALLRGAHEYDPRVDLAIHANAPNLGTGVTIDTDAEAVLLTKPGPEGTIMKLWTYWPNRTSGCIGIVDSGPADPTLDVLQDFGCGNTMFNSDVLKTAPPAAPGQAILAGSGTTWKSASGRRYTLWWERDLPSVHNVKLVFADGTTQNRTTVAGFWIAYLTPAQAQYYLEIYSDRAGHVIGNRTTDLRCPLGGTCGGA